MPFEVHAWDWHSLPNREASPEWTRAPVGGYPTPYPLRPFPATPSSSAQMKDALIRGSLHQHTSGYGYGTWRIAPPKGFIHSTWVSPRTKDDDPDLGKPKSRQPQRSARRAEVARAHLVSGEIGDWLYAKKSNPSRQPRRPKSLETAEPMQPPGRQHRVPNWQQKPHSIVEDSSVHPPIPDLVDPPPPRLNLQQNQIDRTFHTHYRQDLMLHQLPETFQRGLPFGSKINPHAAIAQNELNASLTTHWTHTLRGQKW